MLLLSLNSLWGDANAPPFKVYSWKAHHKTNIIYTIKQCLHRTYLDSPKMLFFFFLREEAHIAQADLKFGQQAADMALNFSSSCLHLPSQCSTTELCPYAFAFGVLGSHVLDATSPSATLNL